MKSATDVLHESMHILWPNGDGEHACGADEIGDIVNVLLEAGFGPKSAAEPLPQTADVEVTQEGISRFMYRVAEWPRDRRMDLIRDLLAQACGDKTPIFTADSGENYGMPVGRWTVKQAAYFATANTLIDSSKNPRILSGESLRYALRHAYSEGQAVADHCATYRAGTDE